MASYVYTCPAGHRAVDELPIGTARRMKKCDCGKPARLTLGVGLYIAAAATPNKRQSVVAHANREQSWAKDMDAYKRMRNRGLQPGQIDGSSILEDQTDDQLGIDYKPALDAAKGDLERVAEAVEEVEAWDNTAGNMA